jgi:hypothetical protein
MSDRTEAWDEAGADPDPAADLGYEHVPLAVTPAGDGRYVVVPAEEDHRTDTEFLIVESSDVCLLSEWR